MMRSVVNIWQITNGAYNERVRLYDDGETADVLIAKPDSPPGDSMKQTETCPKCRSVKLFVVNEVHWKHEVEVAESVLPVAVTAVVVDMGAGGVPGDARGKTTVEAGRFEAWVCASCGYTGWYATRLQELAILAGGTSAVRIVERTLDGGPYRI